MSKAAFCIYAKTKMQISLTVTMQLISAFVFANTENAIPLLENSVGLGFAKAYAGENLW